MTGKPVRSDLRARKKSLPVVAALSAGTAGVAELAALLARQDALSEDDLVHAADAGEAAGGKSWTEEEAARQLAAAHTCLARTGVPTASRPSSPASPSSSRRGNGEGHDRTAVTAGVTPPRALARARDHLLGLQHEQGWWQGELETNVTMDAEDLLLREFLRVRTPEQTAGGCPVDRVPAARGRHLGQLLRRPR